MGLGIEARYRRSRRFWEPHLRCSREFQDRCSGLVKSKDLLLVLGAGRLFDFDLAARSREFKRIELIDADPSCLSYWKVANASCPIGFKIIDATGVIDKWSTTLEVFLKGESDRSVGKLIRFLADLQTADPKLTRLGTNQKASMAISLNLLSQIPLFWRDRFARLLIKYWRIDSNQDGVYEPSLNAALLASMAKLQDDHLTLLGEISSEVVVVICDQYFHYYQKNIADWRTEQALYGVQYSEKGASIRIPNFELSLRQSWLWHLAPQGIESKEFGEIHEVVAGGYIRR